VSADEYETKWPAYCRTCKGIGGHKTIRSGLPVECPDCYGRGLCGRCAADLPRHAATCPSCGWRAVNSADAMPSGDYV
jgi:hypothetical protein